MHVEVPERIPKVEVLKRKPDIVELPNVVNFELGIPKTGTPQNSGAEEETSV